MMHGRHCSNRKEQSGHKMMLSVEKDIHLALRRKKTPKETKIILKKMLLICQTYRDIAC